MAKTGLVLNLVIFMSYSQKSSVVHFGINMTFLQINIATNNLEDFSLPYIIGKREGGTMYGTATKRSIT